MPVLFVGHGSPINAVEDNEFARGWHAGAGRIPRPAAVLSVSTHWYVAQTHVLAAARPRTIHDFWGFPDELYRLRYEAPGAPEIAAATADLIHTVPAALDRSWGLDHGTWTVLSRMYPEADIPVSSASTMTLIAGRILISGETLNRCETREY